MPWLHRSFPAAQEMTRAVSFGLDTPAAEEPTHTFALLSLELRRYMRPDTRITSEIEARIVNRCVLSILEVLTEVGAQVDLAGTAVRPVIEARFDGDEAPGRAVRGSWSVVQAVRRVQRARENEFQVVGALAVGTESRSENGARLVNGPTDGALHRLRDRAAPGEILMSAETHAACDGFAETEPAATGAGYEDADPDTFVLRGVRE
ncbi:MAG: hypothetical protein LC722_08130 [Actinobacteria bacterium]|nr:hypothetical protein [Actinomycetota bacterium]